MSVSFAAPPAAAETPMRSDRGRSPVRLAYLVNQYPQPSQTFIRREIAALETQGQPVDRYTLRRWPGKLQDEGDKQEAAQTHVVLAEGALRLLTATMVVAVTRPAKFFTALRSAIGFGRRGGRGLLLHFAYLAEACLLVRLWQQRGTQHVHVHFGTNATTVACLARQLGGPPYSFTTHGPEEFDRPEALGLPTKIKHAQFVIAVSQFGRSQLCRWCDYADWPKLHVVHCGLDGAFLSAPRSLPPAEPRLACVARLEEQKGLPVLIDAAGQLRREKIPFELLVVGDGRLRPELEQMITDLDLSANVQLLGWRTNAEVRAILTDSRALVLPSFAEGLPVVVMESLAMGRPVVATYVAGISELVVPNHCGWLVPAGSVDCLVEAMREVLAASRAELGQLGAAGAASVAERHDASREAAKLLNHVRSYLQTEVFTKAVN